MRTSSGFQVSPCRDSSYQSSSLDVAAIDLDTSPSPRPPWEVDDQVKSKLCNVLCGQELEKGIMSHYIAEFPVIFWAMSQIQT